MKKTFFIVALSSVLLLIGCKDNSINNPVSANLVAKQDSANRSILNGRINLNQKLINPRTVGGDLQLTGVINYTEELTGQNPSKTVVSYNSRLDISIDATVTDINSSTSLANSWKISSESENQVSIPAKGPVDLVKSYSISGKPEGMKLVCTFSITTEGVNLKNVVLESAFV